MTRPWSVPGPGDENAPAELEALCDCEGDEHDEDCDERDDACSECGGAGLVDGETCVACEGVGTAEAESVVAEHERILARAELAAWHAQQREQGASL